MTEIRETKFSYKKLATIAIPIALQGLIGSSLNFVDNLMVGSLGETELAAVGASVQIYFIFWMLLFGFTSGSATFLAQYFGAGDLKSIKKTVGFTATVSFAVGVLFFLASVLMPDLILRIFTNDQAMIDLGASYVRTGAPCFLFLAITVPFATALRVTHQTKIPLYISVTAFALNTLLNYILIFGNLGAPKMGVVGAALATVISRFVEFGITMYVVFGRKNIVGGKLKEFFGWKKAFIGRIVRNAIPTTINEGVWGLGTSCYVAIYARTGVTAFAAVQASNTINQMFVLAAFSIGDAILILVGQRIGQGDLDGAYGLAKKLVKIGIVIGLIAGGLLIICAPILVGLFEFTSEGMNIARLILTVYGATMWLNVYTGINVTGVLRSGGDTKFAMLTEMSTVWLIGVPIAALMALVVQLPIYLVVLCVKFEEVVKGLIFIKRFVSKKWLKCVIDDIDN